MKLRAFSIVLPYTLIDSGYEIPVFEVIANIGNDTYDLYVN